MFFLILPAFLINENINNFTHLDPESFFLLGFVAVAAFLFLTFINIVLTYLRINIYFSEFIRFLYFFVTISGFALPASISGGMLDPAQLAVDKTHVAASFLLASLLIFLSLTKLRQPLNLGVIIFVFLNTVVSINGIYSVLARDPTGMSIYQLSSEKNIFVLSFDGIPGSLVREVLEDTPKLRHRFAGFIFYDNVASSSPRTSASTATSLYGNQNFKEKYRTETELWDSAPENLLTNHLHRNGYSVSTYGAYNRGFEDPKSQFVGLTRGLPTDVVNLLNYSIARTLTRFAVISGRLRNGLERLCYTALASSDESSSELVRNILSSHSPRWNRRLAITVQDFYEYLKHMQVSSSKSVAHFLHFTHTHYPVEFDSHCQFLGHDGDWYKRNQDRRGVRGEVCCALRQYSEFLDRLKSLNVFDRSLIVLKSDHGKPVEYGDERSIESFKIRGHRYWGFGCYAPFLAIKDFQADDESIRHNTDPVMLDDLARTLCVTSGSHEGCEEYGGYNLLDGNLRISQSERVTLFVVKSPRSNFFYDTHEAVTVRREKSILESLHAALSAEMLRSDVGCEERIRIADAEQLNNGHSDYESWQTWKNRGSSFLQFRQGQRCHTNKLGIEIEKREQAFDGFAILVNKRDIGPAVVRERHTENTEIVFVDLQEEASGETRDIVVEFKPVDLRDNGSIDILGFHFGDSF